MEMTMDKVTNREFFKSHLMAILSEANLHQLEERASLKIVDLKEGDEAEQMAFDYNKQFDLRIKSREVIYIKKVKEALRRIDEGTFGICEECDGAISEQRLIARPTAHLCIGCKEEQERYEKLSYEEKGSTLLNVVSLTKSIITDPDMISFQNAVNF